VHADSARPHTVKVTRAFCDDNFLQIRPYPLHPPYRSDVAPSDFFFFLFGHLKSHLQRQQFGSADELLSGGREILDEIIVATLEAIFRE
jgi:hypothetical protein